MNFKLLVEGWRRRNAAMLDAAGVPMWIIRRRCPLMRGWGSVLTALIFPWPAISAEDIRRRMDELKSERGENEDTSDDQA